MSVDDISTLNRLEVRRFTATAIEAYGGDVNRRNADTWHVTLPEPLRNLAESPEVAVVFDPKDQEPGRDEILVQPGSLAFNQLLELVKEELSVGELYLTATDMQITLPDVLDVSETTARIDEFDPEQTADAVAFHFLIEMESVSSFHRERFETVTLDLANGSSQPELTERLLAHTSTLTRAHEQTDIHPSEDTLKERYKLAAQEVERRIEDDAAELLEEATEAASTRAEEISDLYDQRRKELADELHGGALRQRRETFDKREQNEIKDMTDRHDVNVNISLVGMTLLSHDVGSLKLSLDDGERTGTAVARYAPATGETLHFGCATCEASFDRETRPQICECESTVCAGCINVCEECGTTGCPDCDTPVAACELCGCVECHQCGSVCHECGRSVCTNHIEQCDATGHTTCLACGEDCTSCEAFHTDSQLHRCGVDSDLYCGDHSGTCAECSATICDDHLQSCTACDVELCPDHRVSCETCGDTRCHEHMAACSICQDKLLATFAPEKPRCRNHMDTCVVDDANLCSEHAHTDPVLDSAVCEEHQTTCSTCRQSISTAAVDNSKCRTCRTLAEDNSIKADIDNKLPDSLNFRSMLISVNSLYIVVYGKRLVQSNEIVVLERDTGDVVEQYRTGLLARLSGGLL